MIAIPSSAAPLGADWLARAGWGVSALLHVGLAAAVIGWGSPAETPPQLVAVSVVMLPADALDGGGDPAGPAPGAAMPPATPAAPAYPAQRPEAQPAADTAAMPEPPRPAPVTPAPPSASPAPLADSSTADTPPPVVDATPLPLPAVKPAPPAPAEIAELAPPTPSRIEPAAGSPGAAAESQPPQIAAVSASPALPAAGSGTDRPGSGAGMIPAAALANPEPGYPAVSRQRREEGRVVLLAELSAAGAVVSLTVKQSSGHPRLDRAALEAVRRWRFAPARIGERPVASTLEVPIVFKLTR